MAKVVGKPFGVTGLLIHGPKGQTGDECIPHCHVGCLGRNITISFENGDIKVIKGHGLLDCTKEDEIVEWVKTNLSSFCKIWKDHS